MQANWMSIDGQRGVGGLKGQLLCCGILIFKAFCLSLSHLGNDLQAFPKSLTFSTLIGPITSNLCS